MKNHKLISYSQWKKGTSSALHRRSSELKALDTALEKYTQICGKAHGAMAVICLHY